MKIDRFAPHAGQHSRWNNHRREVVQQDVDVAVLNGRRDVSWKYTFAARVPADMAHVEVRPGTLLRPGGKVRVIGRQEDTAIERRHHTCMPPEDTGLTAVAIRKVPSHASSPDQRIAGS